MSGREWEALLDAARRILPSSLTMAEAEEMSDSARSYVRLTWGDIRQLARAVGEVDGLIKQEDRDAMPG